MRPYFAGHPALTVLFACALAVWIVLEVPQALKRRPDAFSVDRGSLLILRIWVTVAIVLAALALRIPSATALDGTVLFGTGLGLMWCGICLRFWSFRTLGRYF